jgi:hypothetical protein
MAEMEERRKGPSKGPSAMSTNYLEEKNRVIGHEA